MHARFLVTFNQDTAATSKAARWHVYTTLVAEGFDNQAGRWSSGLADWCVIGGRWSGELTRAVLDQEKLDTVEQAFEARHGWVDWRSRADD
jgi:hypothetical protein